MLLPSLRSTDMPNVAPQLRPGGSFAQPSSRRYGFGAASGPGMLCGKVGAAENANAAATATISAPPACCPYRMMLLRLVVSVLNILHRPLGADFRTALDRACQHVARARPSHNRRVLLP